MKKGERIAAFSLAYIEQSRFYLTVLACSYATVLSCTLNK